MIIHLAKIQIKLKKKKKLYFIDKKVFLVELKVKLLVNLVIVDKIIIVVIVIEFIIKIRKIQIL